MAKTFTLFLCASPYTTEHTLTAIKLSEAALDKNHGVNLIASGDGVYNFLKGQKAKGIPNAEERFRELIQKGLKVYL
jgi:sulfur relay (sulfurtransferase) complex TusBCD TusD component (DsrE family)